MTDHTDTVAVYNQTAQEMAKKFRRLGARVEDVARALSLAGDPKSARVVEIGCGDGRDAKEIYKRTSFYVGFDPAENFVKIAQQYVPEAEFELATAEAFDYPKDLDVVFAFASLLHSDKDQLEKILKRVASSLKTGGIFYISLKWAEEYHSAVKKDEFGERLFYFYTPKLISELAQEYTVAWQDHQTREGMNHLEWFTIALQKK